MVTKTKTTPQIPEDQTTDTLATSTEPETELPPGPITVIEFDCNWGVAAHRPRGCGGHITDQSGGWMHEDDEGNFSTNHPATPTACDKECHRYNSETPAPERPLPPETDTPILG